MVVSPPLFVGLFPLFHSIPRGLLIASYSSLAMLQFSLSLSDHIVSLLVIILDLFIMPNVSWYLFPQRSAFFSGLDRGPLASSPLGRRQSTSVHGMDLASLFESYVSMDSENNFPVWYLRDFYELRPRKLSNEGCPVYCW